VTTRPIHLSNLSSYTGTECRQAWDNVAFPEGPDPLTVHIDQVTCQPCKRSMVAEGQCSNCGSYALRWSAGPVKVSQVPDGRLTMHDVETQFCLGCEFCSETFITGVTADQVLPLMNKKRWRP